MESKIRNTVFSAVDNKNVYMIRSKFNSFESYTKLMGFSSDESFTESSDFSIQENISSVLGRELEVVVASSDRMFVVFEFHANSSKFIYSLR